MMPFAQNTRPGECAVRMARAGAMIIGVNCLFDPFQCIETLTEMKAALDEAGEDTLVIPDNILINTWHTSSFQG